MTDQSDIYTKLISSRNDLHSVNAEITMKSHLNDAMSEITNGGKEALRRAYARNYLIKVITHTLAIEQLDPDTTYLDKNVMSAIAEDGLSEYDDFNS